MIRWCTNFGTDSVRFERSNVYVAKEKIPAFENVQVHITSQEQISLSADYRCTIK